MTRARTALGVLAVCALAACAFGAADASAKGLTAVTCTTPPVGGTEFNAHCEKEEAGGGWETKDIPLNETTELEGGNVTPTINELQATLAGLNVTITCEMSTGTGDVKNITPVPEGTMFAHGTNIVIDEKECHVVLTTNHEKTCKVKDNATGNEGTIKTLPLTSITSESEHEVTIKPESEVVGAPFAKFTILGGAAPCFTSKSIEVTVTGSITGKIPTSKPSHVTFEGTGGGNLKANGQVASSMATTNAWMKGEPEKTIAAETR